jgi:hypothetical protein
VNAGVKAGGGNAQLAVPLLFEHIFPSWFAGIGYAAIVIGALVPAAIMSIAAANLFTRNIYREFFHRGASPAQETRVAQVVSLVVKAGALVFVLALSKSFAINLQLLGGVWILQTFPSIVAGLYTRWFHRWALLAGWAAAMIWGTIVAYRQPVPGVPGSHFGASTAVVPVLGHTAYIAVTAFVLNLVVALVLTVVFPIPWTPPRRCRSGRPRRSGRPDRRRSCGGALARSGWGGGGESEVRRGLGQLEVVGDQFGHVRSERVGAGQMDGVQRSKARQPVGPGAGQHHAGQIHQVNAAQGLASEVGYPLVIYSGPQQRPGDF